MVLEVERTISDDVYGLMSKLIDLGREVVDRKLAVGSGGNLSFRMPNSDNFYISGTGTRLDKLEPSSFALVNLEGETLSDGVAPSSEFRVHLESYKVRPDSLVCVHLHPQASVLAASLDLEIKFVTVDHVYYVRKVVRIPWIRSGTQEIADATALAVGNANVVILENHGCVVLASSVELAFARVLNLEEAAELTLRCEQLGISPTVVPDAYREHLQKSGL
jgi:ribulose-5-phosphate 4-epimerase/fuculose-1-phosphate aldolase